MATEQEIRADERAKVEAEVVKWMRRLADTAQDEGVIEASLLLDSVRRAIVKGAYRAPSSSEPPAADPPPVTVEQVMEAWGIDDLHVRPVLFIDGTTAVYCNSDTVDLRRCNLHVAGVNTQCSATCFSSLIGKGANHAEALACALANAAKIGGGL